MNVTFRTAVLSDLEAIIALLADDELGRQREVISHEIDPRYIAAFHAIEADSNQRLIVAESGAEVVGTLQLTFIPSLTLVGTWRAQIEAVRIASQLRGHGLGRMMFEWAIGECAASGCQILQLTTDKSRHDAHRFYESLGFLPSHVGYKLVIQRDSASRVPSLSPEFPSIEEANP
ncbi:GNAT family N-acetyltransferase [Luteolibacter flavescens]|uniref:GNAT family N-acetyltransferase n=1 Tax=Luteolibacter flavescens TaxID=1859460 RepID=A0ABT3FUF7_9BACT|nr:GNAT family N-acetyltransferase [Luteolibacter flavescens]MCW1886934.1 GNAT family N-acetyltransferase [Luteolibacter flavescens]